MIRVPAFLLALSLFSTAAFAEDWGMYQIVSASAPDFVLEAVGGTNAGDVVSIQKPNGSANQKWIFDPKGDGWYWVMPASMPTLTLTVTNGETKNGAKIAIEKENKSDAQLWSISKQENGSYTLVPKHAPGMGLDHFAGKREAGARVDLWQNKAGDQHLQWFIKPLAGTGIVEAKTDAPKYTPPAIKPEDIKEGTIKQFQFTQSKVFPGTVRDVTVFIPAQYDASKPACVYVKTDGYNPREKTLLETMIATQEIPVTVGVFVKPGTLPAPMKGTADRRNRCFEYDGITDNNVRFFDEELLPFVARELQINLSTDGNDRCISGGSSGGIAAFTAAWHRPEALIWLRFWQVEMWVRCHFLMTSSF